MIVTLISKTYRPNHSDTKKLDHFIISNLNMLTLQCSTFHGNLKENQLLSENGFRDVTLFPLFLFVQHY